MARVAANGLEFEYDDIGPKDGEPIVLVMGYTGQMTRWSDAFRGGLAERGHRVVRFDNRDIGLSSQLDEAGAPDLQKIMAAGAGGENATPLAPYTLNDMAADTAGIIAALDLGPSHVLGASMGGMIVQLLALDHPHAVKSVLPVMTTSGDTSLPPATPEAMAALMTPPASPAREDVIAAGVKAQKAIGSHPSIRPPDDEIAARIASDYDRAYRPMGIMRQSAAIFAQPRWHDRLGSLNVPMKVLHGAGDPLIQPPCGKDIADRVPGAEFVAIEHWGHDLPPALTPRLVDEVASFVEAQGATSNA